MVTRKKLTQYIITIIAILIAETIDAYFFLVMNKYKSNTMPYRSTLIHMLCSIAIYYPLITHLDKYIKKATKGYVKQSQKLGTGNFNGMLIGFIVFFVIIWMVLVRIWYNRNMIDDIVNWISDTI
ncbi:MAG: hypothetical protein NZ529_03285 [Cytophagaceae bacterium]|nr:hypothetical protein [Cytophagaceae bacterium]MDW8455793.1 hypothetical protein [Cytophagaceae bacterium]